MMRQFNRPVTLPVPLQRPKLRLALGMTCAGVNSLSVDSKSGTLAYPASGVVVLFDILKNKQTQYIHEARKAVSCVSFSPDSKLLLMGESGSCSPALHVWSLAQRKSVASFKDHCHGIVCARFSAGMDVLASVGTTHDGFVCVRAWPSQNMLATNRFSEGICTISFSPSSPSFVTCGVHHVKFWHPHLPSNAPKSSYVSLHPRPCSLHGRPATLGGLKTRAFVDVAWGSGRTASFVFAVTSCGVICKISVEHRTVKKSKLLRNLQLSSVQVHNTDLIVGSECGYVIFLDVETLQRRMSLTSPLDICFAEQVLQSQDSAVDSIIDEYRAHVFLSLDHTHRLLVAALSNGSLCIWDIKDEEDIKKTHYSVSHSKAISGLDVMSVVNTNPAWPSSPWDSETVVTVSHDSTVRLWQLSMQRSICCESSKTIYTCFEKPPPARPSEDPAVATATVTPAKEDARQESRMITAAKVSPENDLITTGDNHGLIAVYDAQTLVNVEILQRHTRMVTTLCFFSHKDSRLRLMISSGKDRLINIFNVDSKFGLLSTLLLHSSSVTSLGLCYTPEKLILVSAGLDRSVVLCRSPWRRVPEFKPYTCHHTSSSVVDLVISQEDYHLTVGRLNGEVSIFDVLSQRHVQRFHASLDEKAHLEKLFLNKSRTLLLCACTNRTINILSYPRGILLTSVCSPSKGVSGLRFSTNMRYIVSSTGDGCVFVWAVPLKVITAGALLKRLWNNTRSKTSPILSMPGRAMTYSTLSRTINGKDLVLENTKEIKARSTTEIVNLGEAVPVEEEQEKVLQNNCADVIKEMQHNTGNKIIQPTGVDEVHATGEPLQFPITSYTKEGPGLKGEEGTCFISGHLGLFSDDGLESFADNEEFPDSEGTVYGSQSEGKEKEPGESEHKSLPTLESSREDIIPGRVVHENTPTLESFQEDIVMGGLAPENMPCKDFGESDEDSVQVKGNAMYEGPSSVFENTHFIAHAGSDGMEKLSGFPSWHEYVMSMEVCSPDEIVALQDQVNLISEKHSSSTLADLEDCQIQEAEFALEDHTSSSPQPHLPRLEPSNDKTTPKTGSDITNMDTSQFSSHDDLQGISSNQVAENPRTDAFVQVDLASSTQQHTDSSCSEVLPSDPKIEHSAETQSHDDPEHKNCTKEESTKYSDTVSSHKISFEGEKLETYYDVVLVNSTLSDEELMTSQGPHTQALECPKEDTIRGMVAFEDSEVAPQVTPEEKMNIEPTVTEDNSQTSEESENDHPNEHCSTQEECRETNSQAEKSGSLFAFTSQETTWSTESKFDGDDEESQGVKSEPCVNQASEGYASSKVQGGQYRSTESITGNEFGNTESLSFENPEENNGSLADLPETNVGATQPRSRDVHLVEFQVNGDQCVVQEVSLDESGKYGLDISTKKTNRERIRCHLKDCVTPRETDYRPLKTIVSLSKNGRNNFPLLTDDVSLTKISGHSGANNESKVKEHNSPFSGDTDGTFQPMKGDNPAIIQWEQQSVGQELQLNEAAGDATQGAETFTKCP
ncbi:uncharacterized protein LOC101864676 [Aplysia californica]|uniref:Uncharacterized protein LOC101864676 n=1 Tax=Aplysia californica TaxID=6500 RepID=A0ABM1VQC8_APLCA|nr:uncharacterized protein LOC101864676 [Aplysia californica]XP_035824620.1 uncharacterized protein LOC101864676 [Aplysia californica]